MTTSVLPRAICRSGAIASNSPRRRQVHGTDTPTRARRRDGPRAARAAGAQAPPGHLLPDREPRKDAAGTESARSRKTDARPRRPRARSGMTRRARAQPRGGQSVTARQAMPGPSPPRPLNTDPLSFPASEAPPHRASLSPHLLLPRRVLRRRVLVGVDAAPRPPEASTAGPEETGFLSAWTGPLVLPKSPARVLRSPCSPQRGRGPMSLQIPHRGS